MGRPKEFNREDLLARASQLFSGKGYAETSIEDLKRVTGVGKSSLYSEFKDKDELFLCALEHSVRKSMENHVLNREPYGWDNIELYLKFKLNSKNSKSCLVANSVRELAILPKTAKEIVGRFASRLKEMLVQNLINEENDIDAVLMAEIIFSYSLGIMLEQNISNIVLLNERSHGFLKMIKTRIGSPLD